MASNFKTLSQLKDDVNAGITGKIGMLRNSTTTMNRAIRRFHSMVALRSMMRKVDIVPGLMVDVFQYALPSDIQGNRFIELINQIEVGRNFNDFDNNSVPRLTRRVIQTNLTTPEEFRIYRRAGEVAIEDTDQGRALLVDLRADNNTSLLIDEMDAVGSWIAITSAENLMVDNRDYISGTASLSFDIGAAGITNIGGIADFTHTSQDISSYVTRDHLFMWVKIPDTSGIVRLIANIGTDLFNKYEMEATEQSDGTVFRVGWNLVRFDFRTASILGVPDPTDTRHVAFFLQKDLDKGDEIDWKVDQIILRKSSPYSIRYYSHFPWRDSVTGARKLEATDELDTIVAAPDEYELLVEWATYIAALETDIFIGVSDRKKNEAKENIKDYQVNNPDSSKMLQTQYLDFRQDINSPGSMGGGNGNGNQI